MFLCCFRPINATHGINEEVVVEAKHPLQSCGSVLGNKAQEGNRNSEIVALAMATKQKSMELSKATGLGKKSTSANSFFSSGPSDKYQLLLCVGQGSSGKIHLAQKASDGSFVGIKSFKKKKLGLYKAGAEAKTEVSILRHLSHPHIVKMEGAFQTTSHVHMILEYLPGGELNFYIRWHKRLEHNWAVVYAAELLSALEYLHRKGIAHRDIKPSNILIDMNGHLQLVDFGLACSKLGRGQQTSTYCGTDEYLAPEIIYRQPYTNLVDLWAFGCVVYEMLVGQTPFATKNNSQEVLFKRICFGQLSIPTFVDSSASTFITRLLCTNIQERLGFWGYTEIKDSAFFAGINWERIATNDIEPPMKPQLMPVTGDGWAHVSFQSNFSNSTGLHGQRSNPENVYSCSNKEEYPDIPWGDDRSIAAHDELLSGFPIRFPKNTFAENALMAEGAT